MSRSLGQKLWYDVKGIITRNTQKVMWNMKALSFTVHKFWPRIKFFKSRSNFKVKVTRSKIVVLCERSCHKEYTYEIWKFYLSEFINMTKVESRSNEKVTRSEIIVWSERSCHKEYTSEKWKSYLLLFISYDQGYGHFFFFVYGRRCRHQWQSRGYDKSSLDFRHGEVKQTKEIVNKQAQSCICPFFYVTNAKDHNSLSYVV